MQLGKMHLVKEWFWFLYPTKEKTWRSGPAARADNAKLLSEHVQCNVFVVEPNTCVVLLEVDNGYFKLLDSNGNIGWIWCRCLAFSKHFELVKE